MAPPLRAPERRPTGAGGPAAAPGPATARSVALEILRRVEEDDAYADRLLEVAPGRAGLDARDRGLATELVLGTLRWQRWLDWQVAGVCRRPPARLAPWLRALLRLSAYQLAFLDRIPPRAVVHEAVELAKGRRPRGADTLVNGVLRALAARSGPWPAPEVPGDPVETLALRLSQPTWLVRRWWARWGEEEAAALARVLNTTPPLVVRVNTLRAAPAEVAMALAGAGVRVTAGRFAPEALRLAGAGDPGELGPLREGLCAVQDEAAIVVGHALDPRDGETVADVCAAPGTKTTHLAALMGNRGRVLAADPAVRRVERLREACRRLGVTIADVRVADAAGLARAVGPVCDRVLVDAPCSNLGVIRRNPDGKWRRREEDLARLARVQEAILAAAAGLVRPGGILVYATCSLEPEENEGVVAAFLARRPEFAPDALPPGVPAACREAAARLRMAPHRHDSDGFTAHRLRRCP